MFQNLCLGGEISCHFIFRSLQGLASTLHEGHIISEHELHMLLQHTLSQDARNLVVFLQDAVGIGNLSHLIAAEYSLWVMS